MIAVKCPVCEGTGRIYPSCPSGSDVLTVPCHGCAEWGSRGWIVIEDNYPTPVAIGFTKLEDMP